jgi:hypothetical protein
VDSSSGPARSSWKPWALSTNIVRAFVGSRAVLLGALALAIAFWWVPPADALPSFAGQTGAPCSACHVGGFGPQLTPFGIAFKANGYTLGGGTGPWANIPFSITVSPSFQSFGTALPTPPDGYSTTNSFLNWLGDGSALWIAGGHSFDGQFGIGGIEQLGFSITPSGPLQAFESGSDLKLTKPLTVGNHPLVLGFDFTNQPTGGDPYNTLYNGFEFPFLVGFIDVSPAASPAMDKLGTTVYGLSLYAFYDNSIYAEFGLYQTWSADTLTTLNISPSDLGTIAGSAPYFRLAYQQSWGSNFLEVGGVFMDTHVNQVPDALDPSAENEFLDWGLDFTYQRAFGPNLFTLTGNILFETQNLPASLASGLSGNTSNNLTHFRIAAAYYWNNTYGFTLAYSSITGSTDSILYASAPLTGSATGSPNSQAIIAQIDWTPFGKDTSGPLYPWLNLRVGLQYTHYLQFNGGSTNYDGFGRNASDNDKILFFTWLAF